MRVPSRAEELALHNRVLQGSRVATVDVFKTYMPLLRRELLRKEARGQKDDARDSATDALFAYLKKPERFAPAQGRLFTYLLHIARRRAVDRHRKRTTLQRHDDEFAEVVELQAPSPNEEMERHAEVSLILKRLEKLDLSQRDLATLLLICQGERSTLRLAEALGLRELPEEELRREVKRHRDRLMKRLERLRK